MNPDPTVQPVLPPPINPASPISLPPQTPFPKKPILIIGIIIIFLLTVGRVFFLGKSQNNPKVTTFTSPSPTSSYPSPTSLPILPTSSSLPTSDPTANWKEYSGDFADFKISLKYPPGWFTDLSGSSQFPNLRIQNYDPKTAPGRGYDPIQDKGKYLLTINIVPWGNSGTQTLEKLKEKLPKEGDQGYYLGDPAGNVIVSQEKTTNINQFPALFREIRYSNLPNISEESIYILDTKGHGVETHYGLDKISEKSTLDQILSTFKFIGDENTKLSNTFQGVSSYSEDGKFTLSYPSYCSEVAPDLSKTPWPGRSIDCNYQGVFLRIYPEAGGHGAEVIKKDKITLNNIPWDKTLFKSGETTMGASYGTRINNIYFLIEIYYSTYSNEIEQQVEQIILSFKIIQPFSIIFLSTL